VKRRGVSLPDIAFAALLALALPARAELSDEIQVYTDDINAPGEFGLELHLNATPRGRRTPNYPGEVVPDRGVRLTPEFSWGLSHDWEAGLYLPASRDASGNTQLAGAKLRLKWLPVRAQEGATGWFAGANGELSRLKRQFSQSRTTFELRLMGGWRSPEWLLAVNPVFGWNLSDGMRSATADVSVGAKVARTLASGVAAGFEYYSDLGTTHELLPAGQRAQVLYIALDARIRGWDFNAGIGRGLTHAADRTTLKAIVGIPF
jgi:hypothetical protein